MSATASSSAASRRRGLARVRARARPGSSLAPGVALRGARSRSAAPCRAGPGCRPRRRSEVALVLALLAVADAPEPDRIELAKLCSRIENDWVGAQTGLLDQIASLCGEAERALLIDFRSLEVRPVRALAGWLQADHARLAARSTRTPDRATTSAGPSAREAAERLGVESLRDATLEMASELPSAALAARPARGQRERARPSGGGGARARRHRRSWGGCSTPRTPACATATRYRRPRSRTRWRAASGPARWALGSWAAGSGATCSRCCPATPGRRTGRSRCGRGRGRGVS